MKAMLTGIVALALAGAHADTYYVDSAAGDDVRDGLTEATAWRSLDRANRATLKPGDRMLFKRGGLWRGVLDLKCGDETARTYYGAYGVGPKPVFLGSVERNRTSDWEEIRPGLWSTRIEKGEDLECLLAADRFADWGASYEAGVKGRTFMTDEKGAKFVRVTCTEHPVQAKRNHLQLWGRTKVGALPGPMRFRFKVRGDFLPQKAEVMLPYRPYTHVYDGGVAIAEKAGADGWRDASVILANGDVPLADGVIHFNLGELAVANGKMDLMPVGLYRVSADPRATIGKDVGILIFDEGTAWGFKKWTLADLRSDLDYWYDEGNDRVVVKLDRNPAAAYPSVELAKTWTVIPHRNKHDVTVEAFTIRYTGGFAFSGGGANRVTVKNCDISFVGGGLQYWRTNPDGSRTPVRYGNGIEYWSPARDCRVERCRFWQVYDAAVTPQQSKSTAGFDNIVYTDNVFWQCEYSFEFWNHSPSSHTSNVIFEHNTSVDAGYCWSHSQRPNPNGAHLMSYNHVGAMTNQVIRNNVFCRSSDRGFRYFTDWRKDLAMDHNLHYEPLNVQTEFHCRFSTAKGEVRGWKFGAGPAEFRRYRDVTGLDADSLYAEPQFVDPERRDYRLKAGTPGTDLATDGGPVGARNMPGVDIDQSTFVGVIRMPSACTKPDGMAVDPKGRLVIAAPNNDRQAPGAVFRIDAPGQEPVKWFDVPAHPETGYAQPMGLAFGPEGELYVCDCNEKGKGRLLRVTFKNDVFAGCETVAEGLDNANGVKYLNGKLYLTQAFLYGVTRADGAATSGLYMFDAKDRNVRVKNTPDDPQCVFSDITRNPVVRGGLNGVAVNSKGEVFTGNYGDGRIWKLTPGPDGRIASHVEFVRPEAGIVTPDGLCVDADDNVYVADMRGDAAWRMTPQGAVELVRRGGFNRPSEPCAWKGTLYVADYGATTVQQIGLTTLAR